MTCGVYSAMRHPGYAGWALWALGTQILLCNPVCTVLFAIVVRICRGPTAVYFRVQWITSRLHLPSQIWNFFARRIALEERLLLRFFGDAYLRYRERTWSGIPGVP